MEIDICIEKLVGLGVKYGGCTNNNTEEEFNNLRWNDARPKPKWSDLLAKWDEIKDIPKPKTEVELLREELNDLKLRLNLLEIK